MTHFILEILAILSMTSRYLIAITQTSMKVMLADSYFSKKVVQMYIVPSNAR